MLDARCFQFVLLVIVAGQNLGPVHAMSDLCQGKEDELTACSRRLQFALSSNTQASVAVMCRAIENYIKCHHGVAISCHSNPMIQEPGYIRATEALFSQFNSRCPKNTTDVLCDNGNLFDRFVPICYQLINDVTPSSNNELVCSTGLEYLHCLETANAPCVGREGNLDQGISITKTALTEKRCLQNAPNEVAEGDGGGDMQTDLDVMVGDQPDPGLTTDTPTTAAPTEAPDCSVAGRAIQLRKCHQHIMELVGESPPTNELRCRHSRRYLRCILRLMQQCPESRQHQAAIYDPVHADMVKECEANSFRCPFHVVEGEMDIVEFCVRDTGVYDYDVNSPGYCSHLAAMPSCLVRTKNKCKNQGFRLRQVDDALESVNHTLISYCQSDVEARSLLSDLQSVDIQKRSALIGLLTNSYGDDEGN